VHSIQNIAADDTTLIAVINDTPFRPRARPRRFVGVREQGSRAAACFPGGTGLE
jgi:hypothetical protein